MEPMRGHTVGATPLAQAPQAPPSARVLGVPFPVLSQEAATCISSSPFLSSKQEVAPRVAAASGPGGAAMLMNGSTLEPITEDG